MKTPGSQLHNRVHLWGGDRWMGPLGHNLDDELKPWKRKNHEVLDITKLGYSYEQPISDERLTTIVTAIRPRSPFEAE
ncbi:hypothetical protein [Bacillus cereus]|uniref:hypothetical protein n=1 Tax=Bacillus cereus TaxID=1396 RepID=UPI001954B25E|nr:hypothetical protein [Bacillus cereus]